MTQPASTTSQERREREHRTSEERGERERSIGVKLLPRDIAYADHPGHMGVTWKEDQQREFRGFRFNPRDLPPDFRPAARWRDYLFSNVVPGYVVDDVMLRDSAATQRDTLLCKQWPANGVNITEIEARTQPGRHGWYSFASDQHADCNNCVAWAIGTVNRVLGEVIPPVPNGRIKLAIKVLQESEAEPSA